MARIRSIKPEFWVDEKIVELSAFARLLFIGLWNFADDDGRMAYSPKKIKMQIFPADDMNISELFGEIRRASLIDIYTVENTEYLQIKNFAKHQKVDKRTPSKLPPPPDSAESHRIPTTEGIKEGIKEEEKGDGATAPRFSPDDLSIAEQIWHGVLELNPSHKPPSLEKWAETMRLMRERDKREPAEIRAMWIWAHNHDFWRTNILSPDKLRQQWDRLVIQRNNDKPQQQPRKVKEFPR